MMKSRGFRNNNPLNIRRNGTRWRGLRHKQEDSAFFQFQGMAYGYRAAIKILRTYQRRYKLYSLREMIGRWAPPFENNTEAYVQAVANRAKVRADEPVNMCNKDLVLRVVEAMAYVENGSAGNFCEISNGYDLATKKENKWKTKH